MDTNYQVVVAEESHTDEETIDNLYPAIVQCFAVILCGYVAGRMKLINETESKGLNTFVGTFSLPCLIFLSLAELDLSAVNWFFLLAILIAKSIVFFFVIVLTLITTKPVNLGKAGLYAIFCTQSNDFAIGYPIVYALYHQSHPEFASYLYLMAPISLVMLNPGAFILMEIQKIKNNALSPINNDVSISVVDESTARPSTFRMIYSVVKGVIFNPIVTMTLLGIIGNLICKSHIPAVLKPVLQVLGSAFSGTALFALGFRMVGKVHKIKGADLVVPGILIIVKLMVLPLITRETISLLHPGGNDSETVDLSTYGFLYGTFPSAPGVFVFSTQYNIEVDLIANSMVACTFLSAPLMFVSAKMISITKLDPSEYMLELDAFSFDISILSLVASTWLIMIFCVTKKCDRVPHRITLFLILSQMLTSIGMIMWYTASRDNAYLLVIQFIFFTTGVYSARIWTAFLSISLLFLQCRSLCFVLKLQPYLIITGWGVPIIISSLLLIFDKQNSLPYEKRNPNFQYGAVQAAVAVFIITLCFFITVGCLILHQRYRKRYEQYLSLINDISSTDAHLVGNTTDTEDESDLSRTGVQRQETRSLPTINEVETHHVPDIEDLLANVLSTSLLNTVTPRANDVLNPEPDMCPSRFECQRDVCHHAIQNYQHQVTTSQASSGSSSDPSLNHSAYVSIVNQSDAQILKHIVLLILLLMAMFLGLAVSVWTLIMDTMSGIYIELTFLNATLNCGQSLIIFAIFGVHFQDLHPIYKHLRRLYDKFNAFINEKDNELSFETKFICEQFVTHHAKNCEQAISATKRHMLKTYKRAFTGAQLVDWLLDVSLARERKEAAHYAQHLLYGKVIRHVDGRKQFRDSNLLYTFEN